MDPERQPLLAGNEIRQRRYRPLTAEEVLQTRQDVTWRRVRFLLKFLFWGIMAMFLSIIACILIQAPACKSYSYNVSPSIPLHMTFAPLISTGVYDGLSNKDEVGPYLY